MDIAQELLQKVLEADNGNLTSLVVFGSRALNKGRFDSDLDVMLVFKKVQPAGKTAVLLSDIEYELSSKYGTSLSSVYYSEEELKSGVAKRDRILLGILRGYKIIYDRNHFFSIRMEKLRASLSKEGAKYIEKERVWKIPSLKIKA